MRSFRGPRLPDLPFLSREKNYTPFFDEQSETPKRARRAQALKGPTGVALDELKIREVSRFGTGEWTPPIGAMGGPPAHELYRDLVLHAGLQLFKDSKSRPWVMLQDGLQRRTFPVPSGELRGALDRFRMRRNLRPVPGSDIDELVRIVEARISDPDVVIPILRGPLVERSTPAEAPARAPAPPDGIAPRWQALEDQIETMIQDLDAPAPPLVPPVADDPRLDPAPSAVPPAPPAPVDLSISGGRRAPRGEERLPRYLRVLQQLVHDGGWMGTTQELSKLTGDDPLTVFDSLLRFRSELVSHDVLVANVEVDDGYRWLAVDSRRIQGTRGAATES